MQDDGVRIRVGQADSALAKVNNLWRSRGYTGGLKRTTKAVESSCNSTPPVQCIICMYVVDPEHCKRKYKIEAFKI